MDIEEDYKKKVRYSGRIKNIEIDYTIELLCK